ncbi:MAG: regulatory protein RecX [Eggerthellaceae bacterium]|nr:regulatory protein RecX [Eggerthellaceae bacterium]
MKDTADDAFRRVIRILNAGDQSEANIRAKLTRAGYSAGPIDDAVGRAKEYGFIDDARYARLYMESKTRSGKGMDGIVRDLSKMNIHVYDFEDASITELLDMDNEDQISQAVSLLTRKPPRSKNQFQGAYSKLMRNGYSPNIAYAASRRWLEQNAL